MPLIVADRVQETTTTTGTGAIALEGAKLGYNPFSAALLTGDTTYYTIASAAGEWEVGLGTYSAVNTLTRTTVLASSNGNAAVNFGAGVKDVFITAAAETVKYGLNPPTLAPTRRVTGGYTIDATVNNTVYEIGRFQFNGDNQTLSMRGKVNLVASTNATTDTPRFFDFDLHLKTNTNANMGVLFTNVQIQLDGVDNVGALRVYFLPFNATGPVLSRTAIVSFVTGTTQLKNLGWSFEIFERTPLNNFVPTSALTLLNVTGLTQVNPFVDDVLYSHRLVAPRFTGNIVGDAATYATPVDLGAANAAGTQNTFARSDHVHLNPVIAHEAAADPHPQYTTTAEAAAAAPVQSVAGTAGQISANTTAGAVTVALTNTGVTAGSFTAANITVDAQGRVTAASNGAAPRARIGPPTIANATTTTETVVAKWILPPNFLVAGDAIRVVVNHQSAGTGTLIYRLRIGAAGTTADGLVSQLTTSAAQVANAQGRADFTVYFPNTTTANGTGFAIQQAVVLGTPTAASANVTVVPTANIHVSITVTCSAAAANVTRGAWATVGD